MLIQIKDVFTYTNYIFHVTKFNNADINSSNRTKSIVFFLKQKKRKIYVCKY